MSKARCLKLGKRVAFMEADLTDGDGKLLARLTTSAVPMEIPQGGGNLGGAQMTEIPRSPVRTAR